MISTRFTPELEMFWGSQKCSEKLGACMVVGVGDSTAESVEGDNVATVVAGVLRVIVDVGRRGTRLSFSFSLRQKAFKWFVEKQMYHFAFLPVTLTGITLSSGRRI